MKRMRKRKWSIYTRKLDKETKQHADLRGVALPHPTIERIKWRHEINSEVLFSINVISLIG